MRAAGDNAYVQSTAHSSSSLIRIGELIRRVDAKVDVNGKLTFSVILTVSPIVGEWAEKRISTVKVIVTCTASVL